MRENWILRNKNREHIDILSKELNISTLVAKILVNRDILKVEDGHNFLNGCIEELLKNVNMKDMKKGVEKVIYSIKNNKKIIIYGDYDCDGVVSTAILYKGLKKCGANFDYHIPDREDEGYGMNANRIKILKGQGYDLILTCDNGIAAHKEIDLANELGMEVIITDHHDIPLIDDGNGVLTSNVPNAYAVINPKQSDCLYNFKSLCGAGIAFKFISCLYNELGIDIKEARELLEFCSIATVCDVVDLLKENRIIVREGLKLINNTKIPGIKALLEKVNLNNKEISQYHLGFVIGPCINATGRLETANLSVEILITEDVNKAKELATELVELNQKRQDMTKTSVDMVIEQIKKEKLEQDKVLVIYNPYIHESIAGIVAGRIKEKFNVPTIIITNGKDMPKGSARSIEGYNIFEELSKCKKLLNKFGGHPMAAGLSLFEENIPLLRKMLIKQCSLREEDFIPKIKIDARLGLQELNENLVNDIESLEPFGKGNPSPLFGEKSVEINRIWTMGKEKNILKLRCRIPGEYKFIDAISFDKFDIFKELYINKYGEENFLQIMNSSYCNFKIDMIYSPSINEYNGKRSIQIIIKSLRL